MVKFREDMDFDKLLSATAVVHKLKPDARNRYVVAVENPLPADKNVVFHMLPIDLANTEPSIVMLSAQLIIDIFE